jgi:glucose repression mediator protein
MTAIAGILRHQEQFPKAVDFIQNILKLDPSNGEIWGSLGRQSIFMNAQGAKTDPHRTLLPHDG